MQACPSGALRVSVDGEPLHHIDSDETSVQVVKNGPYVVRNVPLEADFNGAGASEKEYILSRCGQSKNKPFCDNSHEKDGFSDYGAVGETGSQEFEHGGELAIKPIKDGPLMFSGNLTIRNSSGRDAWNGNRVALCRCGESANKPFCDGAHKQAGFNSE